MKKLLIVFACIMFFVIGVLSTANALSLTPEDADYVSLATEPTFTPPLGNGHLYYNPDEVVVSRITGDVGLSLLFKQDIGEYPTGLGYKVNQITGQAGSIEYMGGPYVDTSLPTWLLMKDGMAHIPVWYLFDLQSIWNGVDKIEYYGLWPNGGSLSHASLFGMATKVPEPTTLLLLGFGLVGLAGVGRKFKK